MAGSMNYKELFQKEYERSTGKTKSKLRDFLLFVDERTEIKIYFYLGELHWMVTFYKDHHLPKYVVFSPLQELPLLLEEWKTTGKLDEERERIIHELTDKVFLAEKLFHDTSL